MALINKTADITSFKYDIIGGTNASENGTFKTNQKNNTDKKTNFNNTKVEQQYSKLSPDDDQIIKKKPGDRYRSTKLDDGFYRGGVALNVERNAEDIERIGKFLTTPKGALFTIKQVVLQKQNASEHTRGYKIESPITNRPPFSRDERHSEGFFKRPSKTYEEFKGITSEGTFGKPNPNATDVKAREESDKRTAVQPVVLKSRKGRVIMINRGESNMNVALQKEQKETKWGIGEGVKEGNKLNPQITSDRNEALKVKDFISFRIKDMVNNQFIQFPAYLTDISDNSSAEYNPTRYIGRPDQVFVYSGYTRNISFGFKVAALKKADIPILWRKVDKLKLLTLPTFKTNEVIADGEERPIAPFVELTLGNLFSEQPGYFSSVNVTIPQTSTWELDDGLQLPHICDVAVEFTFVGRATPQNRILSHTKDGDGGIDNTGRKTTYDIGYKDKDIVN